MYFSLLICFIISYLSALIPLLPPYTFFTTLVTPPPPPQDCFFSLPSFPLALSYFCFLTIAKFYYYSSASSVPLLTLYSTLPPSLSLLPFTFLSPLLSSFPPLPSTLFLHFLPFTFKWGNLLARGGNKNKFKVGRFF